MLQSSCLNYVLLRGQTNGKLWNWSIVWKDLLVEITNSNTTYILIMLPQGRLDLPLVLC